MLNRIYQLTAPGALSVKFAELDPGPGEVLVRPTHLAICHADQRYYTGSRAPSVLRQKLPMALIHEATGTVVRDGSGALQPGRRVILIPNVPGVYDPAITENYRQGSRFLSSSGDGFMQEYVCLPEDRLLPCDGIEPELAAVGEFISIAMHAISGFERCAHLKRMRLGVWGDGRLGYTLAYALRDRYPGAHITVVGLDAEKMSYFTFADEVYHTQSLPQGYSVDHAFECTGGEGCSPAIDQMIETMAPEGTAILLGVSENKVPVNTRLVLEKGLTLLGRSRSGREDFEAVARLLERPVNRQRMSLLISEVIDVRSVDDMHRAFRSDAVSMFKTVMRWNV